MYFYAYGILRKKADKDLDIYYPKIYQSNSELISVKTQEFLPLHELTSEQKKVFNCDYINELQHVDVPESYYQTVSGLFVLDSADQAVNSVAQAYFKLQMLSQRVVKPHELNLDGIFAVLHNIAWTNKGPILVEDLDSERIKYYGSEEHLNVSHVDKFPYMVNYHVPNGIRIASGSQVRLGAHLGKGTTVMPAGYVNFNAGTHGNAMIEGRVSAGVFVGNDSDVGGGASIMGTLSGGNKDVISIGDQCLLGANSGAGISLGKGCTIAAGLYIYAGMKVSLYNGNDEPVNPDGSTVHEGENIVKAKALSGKDYLLFIQDSVSGKIICKPNKKTIELNTQLHQND